MAKDELIDEHVSVKQCRLAIDALHAHASKRQAKIEEDELLPGKEPHIWLNVTVKKIPPGHRIKPVKVPIAHPLVDPRTTPICLITKDPQRQYKDLLESHNVKFISRVVGIEKLKGKFKPFEARRALLKENGMFLADERVVPLLPKLLGRKWFDAKKQPVPVCLTRKDLKGELERAISSTYMNQNQGTCTAIKIGVLSQKPVQILANLQKALPVIAANIKDGWENIQALHIKTNSSVSLPIWSCALDASEEGRWHGLEESVSEDELSGVWEGVDEEEEAATDKKPKKSTSKKRPSESDDDNDESDEEEQPRKRAKNAHNESSTKSKQKTKGAEPSSSAKKDPSAPTSKSGITKSSSSKAVINSQAKGSIKPQNSSEKAAKEKTKPSKTPVSEEDKPGKAVSSVKAKKGSKSTAEVPGSLEAPSTSSSAASSGKQTSKKLKSSSAANQPEPEDTTASRAEKKWKNVASLDKKKEKIAKQKGGKSIKNSVLGKKVAQ